MSNTVKLFFISTFMLSTACGCITEAADINKNGAAPEADMKSPKDILGPTKVGTNFQTQMLDQLTSDTAFTEAYGMFSEGGWSDDGQTWILANGDMSQFKVMRIAPNREKAEEVKTNADAVKALKKTAASSTEIKQVEESMFDGLIYEYTVLKKVDADIKLEQNTYIKATDLTKYPAHEALVLAFKKVVP